MAQAVSHSPKSIPAPVAARLRALRGRIALWLLVDGASRVLLLVLGLAAVDWLLDYGVHFLFGYSMDFWQRAILLVLAAGAVAAVLVWRLVLPLCRGLSDDALCLQVEAHHSQLGQSLISAVQFSRMHQEEHHGASGSMIEATIDAGVRQAQQVRFGEALDRAQFNINAALLVAALAIGAAGVAGVCIDDSLGLWFRRNLLLADESWPQDVYFEIEDAPDNQITIVEGGSHTLVVRIADHSRRVPDEVFVDFFSRRSRPARKMQRQRDGTTFKAEFKNVEEEFQFRARSGRSVSPMIAVKLLPPPKVQDLSIEATLPRYAGGETIQLAGDKGPYSVLKGSRLSITGKASKQLQQQGAVLDIDGKKLPFDIADGIQFSISIPADGLTAGTYTIELTDTLGLSARRPLSFGLKIRPDREPRVSAELVGVSGMVVPRVRIPVQGRIVDDHRLTAVFIAHAWRNDVETKEGEARFDQLAKQLEENAGELLLAEILDLEPLSIPVGATFTFKLVAHDNDDVSGPNTGYSTEFLVRVVTPEQLRADILRREKEQRQQFEQILKLQEELIFDTRDLEEKSAGNDALAPDQKQTLMQIQRRQKILASNTNSIAQRLENIILEIRNNQLEEEGGPLQQRLIDEIIGPMFNISEELIPAVVQQLDKTRRLTSDAQPRDQALAEAVRRQEIAKQAMEEILLHMIKTEGYQEAINLLYEIEKSQKGVFDLTTKEIQDRIERILQGDKPKTPDP